MQIKAFALVFTALVAGATAAAIRPLSSFDTVAKRDDCPGHISVACFFYGNSACCSWTCDATGAVLVDHCETGGL
jgi:hypothetical protein